MKTVAQLKASRIPKALGLPPNDPRVLELFNKAEEALLNHGRWWGSVVYLQFCAVDDLIVWPRNVATIERIAVSGHPIAIKNSWWQFISAIGSLPNCGSCSNSGQTAGGKSCSCGALHAVDEGTQPLNARVCGERYIRIYPRSATDVGKKVLIQGYDTANQWVRRSYSGIMVDGEYLTLALPFAQSTVEYTAVTGVQKVATDDSLLVYGFDIEDETEDKLAEWQADELNPNYRVSRVSGLSGSCNSCSNSTTSKSKTAILDVIAKLEHIDVTSDQDWLIISNFVALEHAMRAMQLYEQNRDTEADKEMLRAINQLNHELRTHTGDRTEVYVDLQGKRSFDRDFSGFI